MGKIVSDRSRSVPIFAAGAKSSWKPKYFEGLPKFSPLFGSQTGNEDFKIRPNFRNPPSIYRQVGILDAQMTVRKLFSPRPKRADVENACFPDVFRASATFSKT
jgi:hypothetical protein